MAHASHGPPTVFTPAQQQALSAPLNRANVKSRSQSGQTLSYIEGWHAIAEANRIFGFDAWDRETLELRCVSERERTIGRQQKPGWGVTYVCRVRISVGTVIRDGCGAGHGIDSDLGQAHESAIKEAETDAMKRALMTFGNPFGLALYDKQQAQVADLAPPPLVAAAQRACIRAGLTPDGLLVFLDEVSQGRFNRLEDLPVAWLQKLADAGPPADAVARSNRSGEALTEPADDPEDLPAAWAEPVSA